MSNYSLSFPASITFDIMMPRCIDVTTNITLRLGPWLSRLLLPLLLTFRHLPATQYHAPLLPDLHTDVYLVLMLNSLDVIIA
jgi:hypothetical protein